MAKQDFGAAKFNGAVEISGLSASSIVEANANKELVATRAISDQATGNADDILDRDGVDAVVAGTGLGAALSIDNLYHIVDEKSSGTGGGNGTGATWNTRDLNTEYVTNITGASLSANVITLPSGTYWVEAVAPVHSNGSGIVSKLRLRVTSGTPGTVILGDQSRVDGDPTANVRMTDKMFLAGKFALLGSQTLELQQYLSGIDPNTLGYPATTGENEVYAQIRIWKIG